MAEATFYQHEPVMVDYTPTGGAIAAGEVVLVGNTTGWTCGIAHRDIANSTLGALAAGGGVYKVINLDNAADGTKVYWGNSVNKVTTTSTNNATFGFVVSGGGGGANSICHCLHQPYA